MSIDASATEIRSDRLDRDELALLQARALRSWRDSSWLARERPRDYTAIEEFPVGQIWFDLGGGLGESQQQPGAVVLGEKTHMTPLPTGETRACDLYWNIEDCCVPAATGALDKVIAPESTLRYLGPASRELLLEEVCRALAVGGLFVLREDVAMVKALKDSLEALGFSEEERYDQRLDRDAEVIFRLSSKTTRNDEQAAPLMKEVVLGDTRLRPIRSVS